MPPLARQGAIEAFQRWLDDNRPELTWRPLEVSEWEALSALRDGGGKLASPEDVSTVVDLHATTLDHDGVNGTREDHAPVNDVHGGEVREDVNRFMDAA